MLEIIFNIKRNPPVILTSGGIKGGVMREQRSSICLMGAMFLY